MPAPSPPGPAPPCPSCAQGSEEPARWARAADGPCSCPAPLGGGQGLDAPPPNPLALGLPLWASVSTPTNGGLMPFERRPSETERDLRASFFPSEVGLTGTPGPQRLSQPSSALATPLFLQDSGGARGAPDPRVLLRDARPPACPPRRLSTQAGSADTKLGPGVLGIKATWVWRVGGG